MLSIKDIMNKIIKPTFNEGMLSPKDKIRLDVIMKVMLNENIQMAEKLYFNNGVLNEIEKNIILGVSKSDTTTKFLCDVYFHDFKKQIEDSNRSITEEYVVQIITEKLKDIRECILTYKSTVFGVKGYNILDGSDSQVYNAMLVRYDILNVEFKKLPSVALRNNTDKKDKYDESDMDYFMRRLKDFIRKYERNIDLISDIDKGKMFSSSTSLNDWDKKLDNIIENSTEDYHYDNITIDTIEDLVSQSKDIRIVAKNKRYYFLNVNNRHDIKLIGCHSYWCFSSKGVNKKDSSDWNNYSYASNVFILIDFTYTQKTAHFMTVYISPFENKSDVDYDYIPDELIERIPDSMNLIPAYNTKAHDHFNRHMFTKQVVEQWIDFYETLNEQQQIKVESCLEEWVNGELDAYYDVDYDDYQD